MSYYINTQGRTTTLKKKNRNNPPKTKNIINNINNPINNSYHPMNCQCKCHDHIHNTHNTISNQLKNHDSQTNANNYKFENIYNRLSYNINRVRNKSMNFLFTSSPGKNKRYTTNYDYDYSTIDNKENEDLKNKTDNLNKKLNIIKAGNNNLIKSSVIYKNKMQPLYTMDINKIQTIIHIKKLFLVL